MKGRAAQNLRRELLTAGARPAEVDELVTIAGRFEPPAQYRFALLRLAPFAAAVTACFVIGAGAVIASQAVLPGSRLYAIQKFSDNTAVQLHPSYRGTIMMKRAQQIKLLVQQGAPTPQVLSAVAGYRTIAADYRFSSANYDVLEFCRSNLAQAARLAHGSEQSALNTALQQLPSA